MNKKLEKFIIALAALFFLIIGNWANSKPDYYLSAKVLEAGEKQAVIQMANGAQSTLPYPDDSSPLLRDDVIIVGIRLNELILCPWRIIPKDLLVLQRTTWTPIVALPSEYSSEQAGKDGCCVFGYHGMMYGTEVFNGFTLAAELGIPCHIRIMNWTIEGDPILYDVDYDGLQFTVIDDGSRDKWGGGIRSYTYTHFYENERWCDWHNRREYAAILTDTESYSNEMFQQPTKGVYILYHYH